jgi:hypothetical protein
MTRRMSLSGLILAAFASLMALCLLATPALAGADKPKDKGGNSASAKGGAKGDKDGDADSDPGTAYTEDNDTNDGGTPNNVPDEGDNKHPSGKDRSVENGNSGNQGKSESDPDDNGKGPDRSNGGPDKPNGSGGEDLADQDGNNGCGNDDDFEDDNEGWCGGKPKKDKPATPDEEEPPCDKDETMPGTQPCDEEEPPVVGGTPPVCDKNPDMPGTQPCDDTDVDGDIITETPDVDDDDVLGGVISRPPAGAPAVRPARTTRGGVLPFTGTSWAIAYLMIGLGLLTAGAAALRFAKK